MTSTDSKRTTASFDVVAMERWVAEIFAAVGVPEQDAALAASILVEAECSGQSTHGVARLASYITQFRLGELNPVPIINIQHRLGILQVDGDNGLGQVVAARAMDAALAQLQDVAMQSFFVRHAGHLGMLGSYVRRAADAGRVGLYYASQPARNRTGKRIGTGHRQ